MRITKVSVTGAAAVNIEGNQITAEAFIQQNNISLTRDIVRVNNSIEVTPENASSIVLTDGDTISHSARKQVGAHPLT